MIQRQCTTLAAAANNRLLICPPFGEAPRRLGHYRLTVRQSRKSGRRKRCRERIGNFREVRPATALQVLVPAWSEKRGGWVMQHHGPQFPAETGGLSEIAADAAAGQLCGDDSNRTLRDDPQPREADRPRVDNVARRV